MSTIVPSQSSFETLRRAVDQVPQVTARVVNLDALELCYGPGHRCGQREVDTSYLVVPPLVHGTANGTAIVVDGIRRVERLREHGAVDTLCLVVAPGDLREPWREAVRFACNRHRTLELTEQVQLARWVATFIEKKDRYQAAQWLGLDGGVYRKVRELVGVEKMVFDQVVSGVIHVACVGPLMRLDAEGRKAFLDLALQVSMTVQTQRELLDWLPEIAERDFTSVAALVDGCSRAFKKKRGLAGTGAGKIVHEQIRALRFPRLSAAREQWLKCARHANPDSGLVRIDPSPSFERSRLDIRVTIQTVAEAHKVFSGLAAVTESTWRTLLSPGM